MSKYTVSDVADIIDCEGLGYAIQDYMSGDSIEDETLAKLWDEANKKMGEVEKYIRERVPGWGE